ncbi:radical SAM protein [Candidatus Woesearchaeota archaeon]|nr:radical SAM protein [Candidatus Woesearchaeota archaeon]
MQKRVDIKTGFLCNNNCRFCVQAHKKKFGNRTTEDIKKDLLDAKKNECTGVVFTGGEITIRNDLLELVSYAKKLGFESIQLQSNSRMLAYKSFCKKLIRAGANEFSPALHGHIPDLHDFLTKSKGSFRQTTKAIKNLRELDQYIITNTVIVKPNYRYCKDMAELLVELKVDQFQFAFVHAIANAYDNYDMIVPWVSMARSYIHEGLQTGIDAEIKVMAEAMPYCQMKAYEKYVAELYMPETEIRDINMYDCDYEKTRKVHGKEKFPQCNECKYDLICEGPWREYPEKRGNWEFQPVRGKKIKSPEEILP